MIAKQFAQDVGTGNGLNFKLLFVVLHPGLFCEGRQIMKKETQTKREGGE